MRVSANGYAHVCFRACATHIILGISLDPINSNKIVGASVGKPSQEQYRRYFSNNDNARQAFLNCKQHGLGLSDNVWRYADLYKREIELGLDVGLRAGSSADELSRELRSYLKFPDKLFRRVRDERGALVLSQAAKAFHPGQGVYRSSYMNARRLAATETNIAYRTADYERYQDLDFVVGIEVHLSSNHTCKGVEGVFRDICDELQGKYPKDFKFTGWHPHCRCYTTTILKTPAELEADEQRILRGEEPSEGSENEVQDVPQAFNDWQKRNVKRAEKHYSKPYFVSDNLRYVMPELADAYGARNPYSTFAEYEAAMKYNRKHASFSDIVNENIKELNDVMPVMQGKVMDIAEADRGKCNPKYGTENYVENGYLDNCQTCTMTYEARRRGFNVNALGNPVVTGRRDFDTFCDKNGLDWQERFLTADGKKAEYTWSLKHVSRDTNEAKRKFIEDCLTDTGRYEVYCEWKGKIPSAHVFIIEKQADGNVMWFDPQSGEVGKAVEKYLPKMKMAKIGVVRIDDKILNPKFVKRFIKS